MVFDLIISKGCRTILKNFQWWKLVYLGISKGKVTNLKTPVFLFFPDTSILNPSWIFFFGIAQLQSKTLQGKCSSNPVIFPFKKMRFLIFSYRQLMVVTFPYNHTFQLMLMGIIKLTRYPLILTHILQKYSQKQSRM